MRLSFFSIRAAQEAQVIPPIVSSTWLPAEGSNAGFAVVDAMTPPLVVLVVPGTRGLGGGAALRGDGGELRGVHPAGVLEVQVQPVGAGAGYLGVEGDVRSRGGAPVAGCAVRVHVQVRQVAVAQRDQMPVGAEVGLQVGDR